MAAITVIKKNKYGDIIVYSIMILFLVEYEK